MGHLEVHPPGWLAQEDQGPVQILVLGEEPPLGHLLREEVLDLPHGLVELVQATCPDGDSSVCLAQPLGGDHHDQDGLPLRIRKGHHMPLGHGLFPHLLETWREGEAQAEPGVLVPPGGWGLKGPNWARAHPRKKAAVILRILYLQGIIPHTSSLGRRPYKILNTRASQGGASREGPRPRATTPGQKWGLWLDEEKMALVHLFQMAYAEPSHLLYQAVGKV